jgi:GDP-mannose 6-dehydrogenase
MKISVLGLGYVGVVSAGCFAQNGHEVIGVDTVAVKVDLINQGTSPIIETDIGDIVSSAVREGRLRATTDIAEAIHESDLSLICVGTPSQLNGNLDLTYVRRVSESVGYVLRAKKHYHIVVLRSTVLPGTMRNVVIPTLEESSGKRAGTDFGICNNPEFLREGTAVYDFNNPPKTVIGEVDSRSGETLVSLYSGLTAPLIRTTVEIAEMVKYVDNVWHALKVSFANEIGNISKALGIDGHKVMDIFCQDKKLNLSPYYLKPGFAFGGSCLPKDLRALTYRAKSLDLDVPVINAIMDSNNRQIETGLRKIMEKGGNKLGFLGVSFKSGTDDLRESPIVEVIERLLGKGYDIRLYDRNVNLASIFGANRDYIMNRIPHISRLMVGSIDEVLAHAETIVIGNNDGEFRAVLSRVNKGQTVVDLVRVSPLVPEEIRYDGICW